MRSDQIEFFMSCAACLNFSLAAKYHFVSVSTLSRGIDSLEEELGSKLFNRGYHGHELTEFGNGFFETCIEARLNYEYFIRKWRPEPQETLIIGCKPHDGSFERLVTAYSRAPAEYISSKPKVIFITEDRLIKCLEDGIINLFLGEGSDAADKMFTMPFCRSDKKQYIFISRNKPDENSTGILTKLSSLIKQF